MAHVYYVFGVIVAAAALCQAQWEGGISYANDHLHLKGSYESDHHKFSVRTDGSTYAWFSYTFRFRREIDLKREAFKMIDLSGDGFIDVCEWKTYGGSTMNFVALLSAHDEDGDEKISWEECPEVEIEEVGTQDMQPQDVETEGVETQVLSL